MNINLLPSPRQTIDSTIVSLVTLNLGVVRPWVSVLGLQVLVRSLLPLTVHGLWWSWSVSSEGEEDTEGDEQTEEDTTGNLTRFTLWVDWTTWTPSTVGDVPSSLLLSLSELSPWELLSLGKLRHNLLLVSSWKFLPSGLELRDGGSGDWMSRCKSNWSGSGQVSSSN